MSSFEVLESETGLMVAGLRKSFKKRIVIHDVSLELRRGEVVALLGPNGSGKTTTFYSIAGLTSSDGGQVKIDGLDVTTMPMYRRARMGLAYLPQETSIFRGLNVEENIKAILEISTPIKSEPSKATQLCNLLALPGYVLGLNFSQPPIFSGEPNLNLILSPSTKPPSLL